MNQYDRLLDLISQLQDAKIHFTMTSVRNHAIMLQVAVPGERWEIELMQSGTIEIEKFKSDGSIYNEAALADLFRNFKD
ncbi:MAG TPA: hypothetical protein VM680_02915 [Verrucomicrobiae bacterium]|nr:hypothetical protein [Verrucomicrobiae bacterium]